MSLTVLPGPRAAKGSGPLRDQRVAVLQERPDPAEEGGGGRAVDVPVVVGQAEAHDLPRFDVPRRRACASLPRWRPRPRIALSGTLMIGVNSVIPYMPRLVTVNVPPVHSSGESVPARARAARSGAGGDLADAQRSAPRITGTMRPASSATATPMFDFVPHDDPVSFRTEFTRGCSRSAVAAAFTTKSVMETLLSPAAFRRSRRDHQLGDVSPRDQGDGRHLLVAARHLLARSHRRMPVTARRADDRSRRRTRAAGARAGPARKANMPASAASARAAGVAGTLLSRDGGSPRAVGPAPPVAWQRRGLLRAAAAVGARNVLLPAAPIHAMVSVAFTTVAVTVHDRQEGARRSPIRGPS